MHKPLHIRGVIFDLDGTLVSSSLDFIQIRKAIGCPVADVLAHVDSLSDEERRQAMGTIESFEMQDALTSVPLEGAHECIGLLEKLGLPKAILTRNCQQATRHKLAHGRWQFDAILSRDDAPPKPSPEGLLTIAKQWQIPHHQLVYLGDYHYDVDAANHAGMISCLYAPDTTPDTTPDYSDRAQYVFSHLDDFSHWLSVHSVSEQLV